MRRRAITIYADSKEDFIKDDDNELNTEIENTTGLNSVQDKSKSSKFSKILEKNENIILKNNPEEEYFDFLSLNDDFQIKIKQLTLKELEKQDEDKLLSKIEYMNESYQKKNKADFFSTAYDLLNGDISSLNKLNDKSGRSQSYDLKECSEYLDNHINKKKAVENLNYYVSSLCSNKDKDNLTVSSSISTNSSENIILQNLNYSDEILKLIVVGDKAVGKTLFIDKICENNDNSNDVKEIAEYSSTQSLEIKKCLVDIFNKIVKVEIWDTNIHILNSNLIKTYYKLCNGFILICDISNIDSIKFVEKQVENIFKLSKPDSNIILFSNIKDNIRVEEFQYNFQYLKRFEEKYLIKTNFSNFKIDCLFKETKFKKFLNNCLFKKVGRCRNFINNHTEVNSKSTIKTIPKSNHKLKASSFSEKYPNRNDSCNIC